MFRKTILAASFLASTLGATAAFAAPPRPVPMAPPVAFRMPRERTTVWASLGEVRVGGRRYRDASLDVGRDAGRLSKLRFVVKAGDEGLKRLRITFGNGETMESSMTGRFAVLDLPGQARAIESIEITAGGFTGRGRAIVEVLGDRSFPPRHAWR